MVECIYFENSFLRDFKLENCKRWTIKVNWSMTPYVTQEISLEREENFESYYYVDLEIISVFQKGKAKIVKSERLASSNIRFLIRGDEYLCFEAHSRTDYYNDNYAQKRMYQYKITLTPVLQFSNEIFRKPGKRTKIDLLDGLKKFSNDISSLVGEGYYDIILRCGDIQVKAHKNILSVRSTLFNKFLHGAEDDEVVKRCLEIEQKVDDDNKDEDDDGAENMSSEKDGIIQNGIEIDNGGSLSVFLKNDERYKNDRSTLLNKLLHGAEGDEDIKVCLEIEKKIDNDCKEHDGDDGKIVSLQKDGRIQKVSELHNGDSSSPFSKKDEKIQNDKSALFKELFNSTENDKSIKNCLEIEQKSNDDNKNDDDDVESADKDGRVQNGSDIDKIDSSIPSSKKEGEEESDAQSNDDADIPKVILKNITSSIFHEFIDFIYSGRCETFDIEKAKDLLKAARDYGIKDLELKCVGYLRSQISMETSEDFYKFASECSCEQLQIYVLDYAKNKIIGRRQRIIHLANNEIGNEEDMDEVGKIRWLEIMKNHPLYLREILKIKKYKKIKDMLREDAIAGCAECIENILDACVVNLADEN